MGQDGQKPSKTDTASSKSIKALTILLGVCWDFYPDQGVVTTVNKCPFPKGPFKPGVDYTIFHYAAGPQKALIKNTVFSNLITEMVKSDKTYQKQIISK